MHILPCFCSCSIFFADPLHMLCINQTDLSQHTFVLLQCGVQVKSIADSKMPQLDATARAWSPGRHSSCGRLGAAEQRPVQYNAAASWCHGLHADTGESLIIIEVALLKYMATSLQEVF